MLYNLKYRAWSKIANWWERKKPVCQHWFRVISPACDGRRDIEVSRCFWCKVLTSEIYVGGVTWSEHLNRVSFGYGPVEACPVTEDPPVEPKKPDDTKLRILPNRELYYEPRPNVAKTSRKSRTSKKAKRQVRRARKS